MKKMAAYQNLDEVSLWKIVSLSHPTTIIQQLYHSCFKPNYLRFIWILLGAAFIYVVLWDRDTIPDHRSIEIHKYIDNFHDNYFARANASHKNNFTQKKETTIGQRFRIVFCCIAKMSTI